MSEVVGLAPAHPSKIASVHVPSKIRKTNSHSRKETFRALNRQNRQKGEFIKTAKQIIAGIAMLGGSLSFTTTASADWSHRGRELRHDRRELGAARRELGRDLRRGAGPAEIARDRAAIARERREIWQNRRDWRNDRWGYRGNYPHRSWGWRDVGNRSR